MARGNRRLRSGLAVAPVAALGLVAACQSASVRQSLDPSSGVTWTAERAAAVLARTEPQFSRSARDYLYLGPVEVNERGTREYFLWVGIATTLDRDYLAARGIVPDRLYLVVAGEPFALELAPWAERVPALAGVEVYAPSVDPSAELGARVTLDQLRRFTATPPDSVRIGVADGRNVEYFPWRDWSGWPGFLGEVARAE